MSVKSLTGIDPDAVPEKFIMFVDDIRCPYPCISSWSVAEEMINRGKSLFTTQMGLLHLPLLEMGYSVRIWDKTGVYDIKLGRHNERTDREIRVAHNLFRMWCNGEFDP